MRKPRICVAYTGGTIGGVSSEQGITAGSVDLLSMLKIKRPEKLGSILEKADLVEAVTIMDRLSENMTSEHWREIAQTVKQKIDSGIDGIVITHGTDTLEYTASALSFMLKNLSIPVILTGSDYPIDKYERTDALDNLYDSIIASTDQRLKGVYVVFGGIIHRGTKVKKFICPPISWGHSRPEPPPESAHIIDPETCFISVNSGVYLTNPVGFVVYNEKKDEKEVKLTSEYENSEEFKKRQGSSGNCVLLDEVDSKRVHLFKIVPDFDVHILRQLILPTIKSKDEPKIVIVLELYNSGTARIEESKDRDEYSLVKFVRDATESNNPVIITSQHICPVSLSDYESSIKFNVAGAIPARNMTSTAAYVKAKCIVGCNPKWKNIEEFKKIFLENQAGEMMI